MPLLFSTNITNSRILCNTIVLSLIIVYHIAWTDYVTAIGFKPQIYPFPDLLFSFSIMTKQGASALVKRPPFAYTIRKRLYLNVNYEAEK